MPRKGMDFPECIKQMGCLGTPSLPLRLGADFVPLRLWQGRVLDAGHIATAARSSPISSLL